MSNQISFIHIKSVWLDEWVMQEVFPPCCFVSLVLERFSRLGNVVHLVRWAGVGGIVPVYNGTYFSGRGLLAPSCALQLSSDGFLAGVWPACRRLSRAAWLGEWRNRSCQPDANKEAGQICLSLTAALQTHKHTHRNTGHVESWETSRAAVLVNTLLGVYIEWDELSLSLNKLTWTAVL